MKYLSDATNFSKAPIQPLEFRHWIKSGGFYILYVSDNYCTDYGQHAENNIAY